MKFVLCLALVCSGFPALAERPPLQTAKVISQEIGSYNGGAAVMPVGGALVGVPIVRRSNIVVVETVHHRATLSELGSVRHPLVLPVNGTISYYQDRNVIVILDSGGKKHKFGIVHMEVLTPQGK